MKRFAVAVGCGLLVALSLPADAASLPRAVLSSAVVVETRPLIAVNPGALTIAFDRTLLAQARSGDKLDLAIVGSGRFSYVVDQIITDADVIEISGHLAGDKDKTLSLGLRAEGLSGLIKTADRIYALGYANETQYFGPVSSSWMAEQLHDQTAAVETRVSMPGAQPPVKGAEAVAIRLDTLATMASGDSTVMQLPGLGYARIAFDELRPGDGSATWVGHLKDFGDSYKAILTYSPSGAEGTILTPNGEVNITTGADGQTYIFSPAELGLKNGMAAGGDCAKTDVPLASDQFATGPQFGATTPGTPQVGTTVAAGATASNVIDVLVYYTPGMVTAYGSVAAVTTRIDALIALANQAYAAGKLPYQIRRVAVDQLSVADNTTNSSLLSQMQARSGAFSGLDARRAQVGADLVSIVRPFYATAQGNSCGVAYVTGANQTNVGQYSGYALSVVSDGADHTGKGYYCDNVSFAHELGHNMGLMHDRATVASQGGGTGATAYAFGYVPASAKWGTIMSYTFPHSINFSNPANFTCNGSEVCGIAKTAANSADNASALAYTMPLVAAFASSTQTTSTFSVTGVVTLNGSAVAGAVMAVANVTGGTASNVSCTASGSTGVYSCSAPAGYGFKLTPNYTASTANVTWMPASATFTSLAANQTANFAGVAATTKYTLSGTVKVNGVATAGVVMTLSGTGATAVSCSTTNSAGSYACTAPVGSSFTVTPTLAVSAGSLLTWSPASASVSKMAGNATASFAGTLTAPSKHTLTIITTVNGVRTVSVPLKIMVSGTAGQVSCQATSSVTVTCSMPSSYAVSVTPSATGVTFTPATKSVGSMAVDTTVTFTGKR